MEGFCLDFWVFFEFFELEMFHGEHWVGLFFRDRVGIRQSPGPFALAACTAAGNRGTGSLVAPPVGASLRDFAA